MRTVVLLGPQRLKPTLVAEVDRLGIDGTVAAVTAGWQERELEDEELRAHLHRPVVNLRLHARCEQVFAEDPKLFAAHRERQTVLQELQRLYRYRLDHVMEPARELLRREGEGRLLLEERVDAIEAIRRLDDRHLARIAEVHAEFDESWRPFERDALRRHREELAAELAGAAALGIAGGHVAVLLNRLRLFGLVDLLPEGAPLLAWSAGAMACAEKVVLFHDRPPQGAGNAEILEQGLGLFPGLVPLPHARRRLRLDDTVRVALMARRFAPAACVPLDGGESVSWDGRRWHPGPGNRRLFSDGQLIRLEAA